jgi:hypothetical protein
MAVVLFHVTAKDKAAGTKRRAASLSTAQCNPSTVAHGDPRRHRVALIQVCTTRIVRAYRNPP